MSLTEKTKHAILDLQKKYPEKRSALIPALHLAQEEAGYLPRETQIEVADLFEIEPNEVHAVVTFYDMFFDKSIGKHQLHVCKNVSCMLRGSDQLINKICQKLHVSPGETTEDGEYTLIASECLAACDRAPVMIVDHQLIGPVKEDDLEEILSDKTREAERR